MKNENIKLHFNIMKILKYFIFVFMFLLFDVSLNGHVSFAEELVGTVTLLQGSFEQGNFYVSTNYKTTYLDGSKLYYSGDKLKINISLHKNGDACASNVWVNNISYTYGGLLNFDPVKGFTWEFNDKNNKLWMHGAINYGILCWGSKGVGGSPNYTVEKDNTKPTISVTVDNRTKYLKTHTATLSATDSQSGIRLIKYCVNDKSTAGSCTDWKSTYGSSVSVTKEDGTGKYYIHAISVDNVGNESNESAVMMLMDNKAPTISVTLPSSYNTYKKSHSIGGSATDSHSEISMESAYYCLSTNSTNAKCNGTSEKIVENKWIKGTLNWSTTFTKGLSFSASTLTGKYYVHVQVSDNAGNVGYGSSSEKIYLDNKKPEIEGTLNGGFTSWTNNTDISFTVKDEHSGVSKVKICYSEGLEGKDDDIKYDTCKDEDVYLKTLDAKKSETVTFKLPYKFKEGIYLCAFIFDSVPGNTKNEEKICGAFKIDNYGPEIDIKTFYKNKNDVELKASEELDTLPKIIGKNYFNHKDIIKYKLIISDNTLGISKNLNVNSIDSMIQKNNYNNNSMSSCAFKVISVTPLSTRTENRDGGNVEVVTKLEVVYEVNCTSSTNLKLSFSIKDEVENNSESASYGEYFSEFYIDGNGGVTVGGGEVVDGDFKGLFDIIGKKNNAAPQSKQIEIIEEVEIIEVQVKDDKVEIDVLEDEDIVNVEYSIENEEYKVLEDNIVELGNNDIYHLSVRANLVNDILEKKFLVLKEKEKFVLKRLA